jgi:c-di-GMP-binding flagellar brake protein YcgR
MGFVFLKEYEAMNDIRGKKNSLKERRGSNRETGSKEKRNYIRTDIAVPMDIFICREKDTNRIAAKAWNISASGMLIETGTELPVGTEARIDMTPPDTLNPVHCKGRIAWSADSVKKGRYNLGVEFLGIEEDNKNTFLKFLCDLIYKSAEDK